MSRRTVVRAATTASTTARPASSAVAAANDSGAPPLTPWDGPNPAAPRAVPARLVPAGLNDCHARHGAGAVAAASPARQPELRRLED
jgi:hypothetical protein